VSTICDLNFLPIPPSNNGYCCGDLPGNKSVKKNRSVGCGKCINYIKRKKCFTALVHINISPIWFQIGPLSNFRIQCSLLQSFSNSLFSSRGLRNDGFQKPPVFLLVPPDLWVTSGLLSCWCSPVVFNLGVGTPEELWSIFGEVTSRYFMYTALLHLLYSSFRWGSLGYIALLLTLSHLACFRITRQNSWIACDFVHASITLVPKAVESCSKAQKTRQVL